MKIPVQNVYYLLCYAWGHAEEADAVPAGVVGRFERLDDLLGLVLAQGTFRVLHRGLDRGYRERSEDIPGIRGKLDVGETAKRALKLRARTRSLFEELSHDVLHNRILKSTLGTLLRAPELDAEVRRTCGLAYRRLEGIGEIRLDRSVFGRVQLDANRRTYRFLLAICALLHERLLIDDSRGGSSFQEFVEDPARMWKLFEDFVTEFYRREQDEYRVKGQKKIPWHGATARVEGDLDYLPSMWADVILDSDSRRIILDAKFHRESLVGPFGAQKLKSGNLYQLLSYLRNRQASEPDGPRHEGVLLYPVVDHPLAVEVHLEGFRIRARGIDLSQDWGLIHEDMLAVIN